MKNRKKDNWEKFTSIVSLIVAIAAVIVAITANEIAQKSYEIVHQANLPSICAICKLRYDATKGLWNNEELIVNNDGYPVREFECLADAVMVIEVAENQIYIPLPLYFGARNFTGNGKDLLVTLYRKNNYFLYSSIKDDFTKEAVKDGYQPYVWQYKYMHLSYEDYTGVCWSQYYRVDYFGSFEISQGDIIDMIVSADNNMQLMWAKGLDCEAINGTELWHWYKEEILEPRRPPPPAQP